MSAESAEPAVDKCLECKVIGGHKMDCETGRAQLLEPENAELLRNLAKESHQFAVMLADALETARKLQDRAAGMAVLGLRDGFDDPAALRAWHKDTVKAMVGAGARGLAVDDLLAQLPE